MMKPQALKFSLIPVKVRLSLILTLALCCPILWAKQHAVVTGQNAVVYSDKEMTKPVGYIARGKKIVIGSVARNKAQVYPIVVSGKIAYIQRIDVTTEKDAITPNFVVSERFNKKKRYDFRSKFAVDYFAFSSKIETSKNVPINKASLNWHGLSLRGEVIFKNNYDFQIITNFMTADYGSSSFKIVEFGGGVGYHLIDAKNYNLKAEVHALAVPFSSYEEGRDFRVNSYGYTLGTGLNFHYLFGANWGMEVTGGIYRTSLLKFNTPAPYENISPVFLGTRLGIGFNYLY